MKKLFGLIGDVVTAPYMRWYLAPKYKAFLEEQQSAEFQNALKLSAVRHIVTEVKAADGSVREVVSYDRPPSCRKLDEVRPADERIKAMPLGRKFLQRQKATEQTLASIELI